MIQNNKYKTFIFDCDGVILDSNALKTQAFYQAALNYGEFAAQELVKYHIHNGGISRYRKFEYFLETILGLAVESSHLSVLLETYASLVLKGQLTCKIAPGLQSLREALPNTHWLVVSGSDQAELRQVFAQRGISDLFDGGIFGSPDDKNRILARELAVANIQLPAIFLGDSLYDYQASKEAGLDFIFVSGWTDFKDWESFCNSQGLAHVGQVLDLLSEL